MAKEPSTTSGAKVRAKVVRGSFWKVGPDGEREEIKPGLGDKSIVEVSENQLNAFIGVLVRVENAAAEEALVATESMQKATPTEESTTEPSAHTRRSR